jgi:hypothetical protein
MSTHRADRVFVASTSWERSLFAWSTLVFWAVTVGSIVTQAPTGSLRDPSPTVIAAVAPFVVSLAAMLLPRLRPSGAAEVTVDDRRLAWRRAPFEASIPRSKLLSGHMVRSGAFFDVELRVSDGRLLRIGFQTMGPARALLEDLGLAAATHRAAVERIGKSSTECATSFMGPWHVEHRRTSMPNVRLSSSAQGR